jgi:hypothetical protein
MFKPLRSEIRVMYSYFIKSAKGTAYKMAKPYVLQITGKEQDLGASGTRNFKFGIW